MKKISNYIQFNQMTITVEAFLDIIAKMPGYKITKVPFKRDLRFWNDSPWSLQPDSALRVVRCDVREREEDRDYGVYQFWRRKDGMGVEIEYFETYAEYEAYSPSDEYPHSIKQELGLCANYHIGV